MALKTITIIMAILIFASSLSANGVVLSDCQEQVCCCHGMVMADDAETIDRIQSLNGCCCSGATGSTCSLTMIVPSENMGWALSPNRVDPSDSLYFQAYKPADTSFLSEAAVETDFEDFVIDQASPPTYLTLMSFLC